MKREISINENSSQKQKYLGNKGLIILTALLSAFIPLSIDLYLPALPNMAKYFNASVNLVNLTLILFIVFYALGTLFWGPLSDKYGRKPILLIGLSIYMVASILCATSWNVYVLIIFRILQAIGGSAASAVAPAMVKDVYSGRKRESVLALVQSMMLIAPAIAPVLGAFLLRVASWRGVFLTLTGIGLLALIGSIFLVETIDSYSAGTLLQSMSRLGVVMKNPGFTFLLILFSLVNLGLMAFVASSSYIYQNQFALSAQVYSYYFALNAVGLVLGPMLYMKLSKGFNSRKIIIFCFLMTAISGLLVCRFGSLKPWLFAIAILPSSLASSCVRVPGTNLMLEQQKDDTGSASALMGCVGFLMGSIGMLLISFNWSNVILVLGIMNFIIGLISLSLWLLISRKAFIKQIQNTSVSEEV